MKPRQIEFLRYDERNSWFRTSCGCDSTEHPLTVTIDVEDEYPAEMLFKCGLWDFNAPGYFQSKWRFFRRMWFRITMAWEFLTKGYITLEEAFIFRNSDQIKDLIEALEDGRQKILDMETDNSRSLPHK